ncbi:MAG: hypothetical protein ACI865_003474 [Flavobacteriaceae bacterium]
MLKLSPTKVKMIMRNLLVYSVICLMLLVISLFLPYESHDQYHGSWLRFNGPVGHLELDIRTTGIQIWPPFIAMAGLIITSSLALFSRSTFVSGLSYGLAVPFLLFFLMAMVDFKLFQFDLKILAFDGVRNSHLLIGYYLGFLAIIGHHLVLILNLIRAIRKAKSSGSDHKSLVV